MGMCSKVLFKLFSETYFFALLFCRNTGASRKREAHQHHKVPGSHNQTVELHRKTFLPGSLFVALCVWALGSC